ncbi:MAG: hypothetical protein ABW186_01535 [Rhodanobacteraceae bacterium]
MPDRDNARRIARACIGIAASSLVTALAAAPATECPREAHLQIVPRDVDRKGAAFARFREWVDAGLAGKGDESASAADAAILAQLSSKTDARRYCEYAVKRVDADVGDAGKAIAAGHDPKVAADSYLYVGSAIEDLSYTWAACAPSITDAQRARWKAYADQTIWNVWHHEKAHWGERPSSWTGWATDNPANNYYYSFVEATMDWSLASGDAEGLRALCETRLPLIQREFAALPGGGSLEGTGYGVSHGRLFSIYRVWRDATGIDLANASPHLTDTIAYWTHATVPTLDRYAPIGDQARVSTPDLYDYHRTIVLEARNLTSDPAAKQLASWWLSQISVPSMTAARNSRDDLLPTASRDLPAKKPSALTYYAAGVGTLFARTDWTKNAMWLAFIAGKYTESHAHQEQGGFTLFDRDWLAVTENIWTHSGIEQGTETHNVLRFSRGGKVVRQHTDAAAKLEITRNDPAKGLISATADLSPLYAPADGVRSWKRTIDFANRKLAVHDDFAVADGVDAVFQIDVPQKPVVDGANVSAGRLRIHVASPANPKIRVLDWTTLDKDEFRGGWRIDIEQAPGKTGTFDVELTTASR